MKKVLVSYELVAALCSRLGLAWSGQDMTKRINSPLRSGSDSESFSIEIQRSGLEYTGHYFDFVNEQKGSLLALARALGIEEHKAPKPSAPSKAKAPKPSAPEYKNLEEYAQAHGVDVAWFREAGWSDTTYSKLPALAISTQSGTRWRLLQGQQKYASPKGYKPCWYRLEQALKLSASKKLPIVLCNGEASVVAAQAYQVPALAIAGRGEQGSLSEELIEELLERYSTSEESPREILIAFDCDKKGRESAPKLQALLESVGYDARALDLGLELAGGDLADFLKAHTLEELYQLPSLAQVQESDISESLQVDIMSAIHSTHNLESLDIQAPDAIIQAYGDKPLLLSDRVSMLSGDFKLGKSTFCLHLGYCVAIGAKQVLGTPDLFVEKAGRVLILDLEQELSDSIPRAREMGALSESLDILDADSWERLQEQYGDQYDADTLARTIIQAWCTKHSDRALVIVDNLSLVEPSGLYGLDRGALERLWITRYKSLAKKYGISVILVEHNNKAQATDSSYNSKSRYRGTLQKAATPNGSLFSLSKTRGSEEESKGEIRLEITGRSVLSRTLYLKRDNVLGHHILSIKLEGLSPEDYKKIRSETHAKVISQLESGVIRAKDIALYSGLNKSTVHKALEELAAQELVVSVQHGVWSLNVKKLRESQAQGQALPASQAQGQALPASTLPALEQARIDSVDA